MTNLKIGDFVIASDVCNKSKKYTVISRIKKIRRRLYYTFALSNGEFSRYVEVWKPKEGEYCWFYNSKTEYHFGKLQSANIGIDGLSTTEYYPQEVYKRFDFCEPFTGEIPTFLKSK